MKRKGILIGSEISLVAIGCLGVAWMMNQQEIQALRQPQQPSSRLKVVDTPEYVNEPEHVSEPERVNESEYVSELANGEALYSIAVLGMDAEGYRPDVIFVVSWDEGLDEVVVTSIPRDTYILWSEEARALARANGFEITESKINEMLAYGGMEHIRELTLTEVERLLERKVDRYMVITLDLFRKVVDAVGGVVVDVPAGIPGLTPGRQLLDGTQAERMVRFRGYTDGDLGRIKAQQVFLSGVAMALRQPSTWPKLPKLIEVFFEEIETDIGLWDIPRYYKFLKAIDKEQVNFCTLPGTARYKGSKSYFFVEKK